MAIRPALVRTHSGSMSQLVAAKDLSFIPWLQSNKRMVQILFRDNAVMFPYPEIKRFQTFHIQIHVNSSKLVNNEESVWWNKKIFSLQKWISLETHFWSENIILFYSKNVQNLTYSVEIVSKFLNENKVINPKITLYLCNCLNISLHRISN